MYKAFKPSVTHFKILETVKSLNDLGYYPLAEGIGKILKGSKDEDIIPFKDFVTYGTLISFSSKKICRYVLMLSRYNYLENKYDAKTNELYLKISKLGIEALTTFKKKHKSPYKKKDVKTKVTIVKID